VPLYSLTFLKFAAAVGIERDMCSRKEKKKCKKEQKIIDSSEKKNVEDAAVALSKEPEGNSWSTSLDLNPAQIFC
jgi:hypothetical protein